MANFVHLHSHSEYSVLDGLSRVKEIVDKAVEYKQKAVAITDHGHLGSVPTFYTYAKEKGIKPIIGQEFYIVDDTSSKNKEEKRNHIIILAINGQGYKTLCKLSTEASEHFYYKPRIDGEILRKYSKEFDNIIALSGCMSSPLSQSIVKEDDKLARKLVQFYNILFPNFYLEFQKHGYRKPKLLGEFNFSRDENIINKRLLEFHKEYNIPIVVTNDSHYIDSEDRDDHEVLLAIQTASKMDDSKRFKFNGKGYSFCDARSMQKKFSEYVWSMSEKSMEKIVKQIDMHLPEFDNKKHFIPTFGLKNPNEKLRQLSLIGLRKRVPKSKQKKYKKHLKYQLKVIEECGYADEFLIVKDYVDHARLNGIQVGSGRGSMSGVLISYLLGITDIDPIRFNLSFERALNPERPSLPDFDIDFSDKDFVIKYLKEKYGYENTMQVGTYNRMHYRSLLRALLKTFGYDYQTSIKYTKQLPDIVDIIAEKSTDDFQELRKAIKGDLSKLFDNDERISHLMHKFNGLVQSVGTHAGGLLIGDNNLKIRELIPTFKIASEKDLISQFDKKVVEKQLGFVKFDILGITTLEIIQNCLKLIGKDIFDSFPDNDKLDDRKTFELLNSGNLTYVFQLDGAANRITIDSIGGIHGFEDIVITTSISRPGTSQFISELAENKKNGVSKYIHKDLENILGSTYGVLLYQEQVMDIARHFANFSMSEVDDIKEMIKGKDHSEFEAMKPKFIKGCVDNGYKNKMAMEIWRIIERASGYLYNRSHAVSYSVITYQTAYLKAHYPLEFFIACMAIKTNEEKIKSLMQESVALGISILAPDIRKSDVYSSIENQSVRLGISMVKNIGVTTATNIVGARQKNGVKGILSLPRRVLTSRVVNSLRDIGAFGEQYADYSKEQELLGFTLHDPVNEYVKLIQDNSWENENELVMGGTVIKKRKLKTKHGADMAFVDISVNGNKRSLALFVEQLYEFDDVTEIGNVLLVRAKKQHGYDSVVPNKIKVLNDGENINEDS